jgi:CRP/FNR family transcriptional regulator, cyclic AMP receptor protein
MVTKRQRPFDTKSFLARVGNGQSIAKYRKGQAVFSQGVTGDAVFYIQKGKAKLTVVSDRGKEAVIAFLGTDDFFGEGCLAGQAQRIGTVTAMTDCVMARLEKAANKFRKLGFIEYNGGIEVHSSLLNVVLHDQPRIKT